ncbi:MAG: 5'/3'-nucleotidase SurE [Spirochaetia bacterium]
MNILLTNDDGVTSPGIYALKDALEPEHSVCIIAPDTEQSGTSHKITLKDPLRVKEVEDRVLSCGGTPADCVMIAYLGAAPEKPDLVISGINFGPNLGTDIIYSGTAAAARQAALMGYPGIAVSLATYTPPFHFEQAAAFIAKNLMLFLDLWAVDHFINVNFPNSLDPFTKVEITHPTRRRYNDSLEKFKAPNGDLYYFLKGTKVESDGIEGSDFSAVDRGSVSVSPVYLHPVNHEEDKAYRNAGFTL